MPRTTACPSCGAALRPDAPWCTLCYTDLRPKPAPEPAATPTTAPPTAAYGIAASDPLTQPLLDFLPVTAAAPSSAPLPTIIGASWPCTACAAINPLAESLCSVCGQPFLAAMKVSEKPLLVLPGVGDFAALSRGQRAGLAVGLLAAILIPLAIITLLLTHKPAKDASTPNGAPTSPVSATQPTGGGTVIDSTVPIH
jgi:hypothetical protein